MGRSWFTSTILLMFWASLTGCLPFDTSENDEKAAWESQLGKLDDMLKIPAMDEIAALNTKEPNIENMIEGDILKNKGIEGVLNETKAAKRDASTFKLWPNGVVPYRYEINFGKGNNGKKVVEEAVEEFTKKTCIRFRPWRKGDKNYIAIYHGKGCFSIIGEDYKEGYQPLSLAARASNGGTCLHKGVAIHEIMHAVGFFHEQARLDRGNHVRILWQNIIGAMQSQFQKHDVGQGKTLGEGYDKDSIMHYGNHAFSKNGRKTIEWIKDPNLKLGHKNTLSEIDVKQLNKLYNCNKQ